MPDEAGSRATAYLASSSVLSAIRDYTFVERYVPSFTISNQTLTCSLIRFNFQVMARGLSTEPAEFKEWKPEHSWDYTIRIDGIMTQMGAKILINLNNPTDIPPGSLGLWFYMKKDGSGNSVEGPSAKRKPTNVARYKDVITAVQTHTRIICSSPDTWLEPLPDNTAYVANVSFLIWCPAYHEARFDHSSARVKQPRPRFQYVDFPDGISRTLNTPCRLFGELRDHTGRVLATTVLRRTWGGDKRSRQLKKDADRRSGHRASISGEPATPQVDSHIEQSCTCFVTGL